MKKGLILVLLLVAMVAVIRAEDKTAKKVLAGTQTILAMDTVVATDSIRVACHFWPEYQEGYYHFFYRIRNVANNTKVKIYCEYALDTLWGWYNRELIDSIVAAESTLVLHPSWIKGTEWLRFIVDGFGSAGDSSTALLGLQTLPVPTR